MVTVFRLLSLVLACGGLLWDADDASPEHAARAKETRPDAEPGR